MAVLLSNGLVEREGVQVVTVYECWLEGLGRGVFGGTHQILCEQFVHDFPILFYKELDVYNIIVIILTL